MGLQGLIVRRFREERGLPWSALVRLSQGFGHDGPEIHWLSLIILVL